jgi:anti-anti-sigma factor
MADLDPAEQAQAVVDVRDENGSPVIWLSGELDMTSVPQASAAIDAALASHPGHLVLDASSLEYMDSSGIALLARMASKAREVQVRNPTPIVRRLIELTGLSQILRIVS